MNRWCGKRAGQSPVSLSGISGACARLLVAGLCVAVAGSVTASTVPFTDSFNSYPSGTDLNGSNGWAVAGSGTVIATNNRARILNNDTNVAFYNTFSDAQPAVSVSFAMQPVYTDGDASSVIPDDATFVFYVGSDGYVRAYDGATLSNLTHDAISDQYATNFQINLDYGVSKWSLAVGGVEVVSDFDFYSSSHSAFGELKFTQGSTSTSFVTTSRSKSKPR